MKNTLFIMIIIIFSIIPDLSWGDVCSDITAEDIKKHVSMESFTIVSKREINALCEIIVDSENKLVPFYGNKKFMISGEMYEKNIAVTANKIYGLTAERFKNTLKEINDAVAFTYIPSKVKTNVSLYMFTDPLCPYCNKIGGDIKALSDRIGFKVKVLLYTVHGEKGKDKCIEAACRSSEEKNFNLSEYNSPEWKKKETDKGLLCKNGEELYKKTEAIAEKIDIDSVPYFFIDDGNYVNGASIEDVEALFK